MKNNLLLFSALTIAILSNAACTTTSTINNVVGSSDSAETLFIYEDGRMELNSRFVNDEDVIIYEDGRGGELAAIKIRVPIHPDFYRNSIVVVRIVNTFDESIGQREADDVNNIN